MTLLPMLPSEHGRSRCSSPTSRVPRLPSTVPRLPSPVYRPPSTDLLLRPLSTVFRLPSLDCYPVHDLINQRQLAVT
jgi:hypothetical protein